MWWWVGSGCLVNYRATTNIKIINNWSASGGQSPGRVHPRHHSTDYHTVSRPKVQLKEANYAIIVLLLTAGLTETTGKLSASLALSIPIISNHTIRSGADLSNLSWNALLPPQSFQSSVTNFVQKQRSSSSQTRVLFSVFVYIDTGGVCRFVVVHQEDSALLNQKEHSNARSILPCVQGTGTRRTRLLYHRKTL